MVRHTDNPYTTTTGTRTPLSAATSPPTHRLPWCRVTTIHPQHNHIANEHTGCHVAHVTHPSMTAGNNHAT